MLTIENVTLGYEDGRDILRNITLEARRSEILCLIGRNGSGKTTLLRGITGLLPLRSGEIRWEGQDLSAMDPRKRARLISVVPQAASLPAGYTVYETVSHGRTPYLNWYGKLSPADEEIIGNAIRITGLGSFQGKEVSGLSGGEQQRVILARALTQDAPVMILDEPTSYLDLHYQVALLELEREICREKGLAVIMIIHDLNLAARYADRIAILQEGRIIETGTPAEVLREDLLSAVYDTPVRVIRDPRDGLIVLPAAPQTASKTS